MRREYTHELGTEIRSISGAYRLDEEERKEIAGKEILYAIGNAVVDSACCGSFGCYYAVVLGYVVKWKFKRNDDGLPVSEVEPIRDELSKKEIEQILRTSKGVSQVLFW